MPKQNRVTPRSEIVAIPARGQLMGNRGCLHDAAGNIRRNSQVARWIICRLDHPGPPAPKWEPGRYTALFFHDEAVALAAGHRPCWLCNRDRLELFRSAWETANGPAPSVDYIDGPLHQSRLDGRRQRTHESEWSELPDGAFTDVDGVPHLMWDGQVFPWTPASYGNPISRPTSGIATVLTPELTVSAMRAGFRPMVEMAYGV